QRQKLLREIDEALDRQDKESFEKLAKQLSQLR
ncbi:IDEAL domain-containing protein, partial [Bacillus licheniformis]